MNARWARFRTAPLGHQVLWVLSVAGALVWAITIPAETGPQWLGAVGFAIYGLGQIAVRLLDNHRYNQLQRAERQQTGL